jgi:DNA-binding beta-propeller fold protein YncE
VTAVNPPTGNIAIQTSGAGPAQGPTGQVANQNPSPWSFPVGNGGNGGSAHFIFANLNGTISAWDAGSTAFIQVTTPGANYSGLAINQAQTQLYAANQAGTGSIDVFNSSFAQVPLAAGAFATPQAVAASINRFRLAPRISDDPGALRALSRTVAIEQSLGLVVLAVVSILGSWPPAVSGGDP